MKKILLQPCSEHIGTVLEKIFVTVRFYNHPAGMRLFISSVHGPRANGGCRGSAGQYRDFTPEVLGKGWTLEMVDKLKEVWEKWHLNDLHAGTIKQEDALLKGGMSHAEYDRQVEYLRGVGLEPDGTYHYGDSWLYRELPADVVQWLESLPESPIPCPWHEMNSYAGDKK